MRFVNDLVRVTKRTKNRFMNYVFYLIISVKQLSSLSHFFQTKISIMYIMMFEQNVK